MTKIQDQQRFFEALALLRLCRRGSGRRTKAGELRMHDQWERALWHQALDELSWLADGEPAGRTVTSIAGVEFSNERILLVAANREVPLSTQQHLRDVLEMLQKCSAGDDKTRARLTENIVNESVIHSWRKVVNYQKQLHRCVTKAFATSQDSNKSEGRFVQQNSENSTHIKSEKELQRALIEIGDFGGDRAELCKYAYNFRDESCMTTLERLCDDDCRPIWRSIRHLLGRLGMWYKSAKALVRIAWAEPHLLSGLKIHVLQTKVLPFSKPTIDESSFDRVLRAACPSFDLDKVLSALQRIQLCNPVELRSKFEEILKDSNLKPFIHAEILLADHIFANKLSFVRDDRYIGCSKPSCYNCQLYLELHPSKLCRRPSHGNLWLKWSPSTSGLSTHYGEDLFEEMVRRIYQDIVASLLTQPSTKRFPDSSSGLSRSVTFATRRDSN